MFFNNISQLQFPKHHCDLWIVNLQQLVNYEEALHQLLNHEEKAHLAKFTNLPARTNFLGSRGFLRLLASSYLQTDPATLRFANGTHGKPLLLDFPELHFNISHSQDLLVLLFAPCQCGIDIESLSRPLDFESIIKRFFEAEEIASWQAQSEPRQAFFRGWTRKEAYLKATGEGISGIRRVHISFAPGITKAVTWLENAEKPANFWYFSDFAVEPDYVGSVALAGVELPLRIQKII